MVFFRIIVFFVVRVLRIWFCKLVGIFGMWLRILEVFVVLCYLVRSFMIEYLVLI